MRMQQILIDVDCELDDEYFGDWDLLSPEIKKFWESHTCNCEGTGIMGSSCYGCPFCDHYQEMNADEL